METPQEVIEDISDQIKRGFTSGRIDGEDGQKTSWSLDVETWKD